MRTESATAGMVEIDTRNGVDVLIWSGMTKIFGSACPKTLNGVHKVCGRRISAKTASSTKRCPDTDEVQVSAGMVISTENTIGAPGEQSPIAISMERF